MLISIIALFIAGVLCAAPTPGPCGCSNDMTPPVPVYFPPSEIVECASQVPPEISNLGAVDACSGMSSVLSPSTQTTLGSCPNDFEVERSWFFSDACNNNITVVQTITVSDTASPVFNPAPPNVILSICFQVPAPEPLLWIDNCDGNGTVVGVDSTTPDVCTGGVVQRTWAFADSCGNQATSRTQTLTFLQRPGPVINCPANAKVFCGNDTSSASTGVAIATDSCNSTLPVVITESDAGSGVCSSFIIRTWTVRDTCNRTHACNQVISVIPISPKPLPYQIDPDKARVLAWIFGLLLTVCVVALTVTCIWGCRNGTINFALAQRRRSSDKRKAKKNGGEPVGFKRV